MKTASRRKLVRWAVLGALSWAGVSVAMAADNPVDPERLRRHVMVLGSDAFGGRAPGTVGGERAAAYIAGQLRELGVATAPGCAGYRQPVPLLASHAGPHDRLRIHTFGEWRQLVPGEDYLLHNPGAQSWVPRPVPMVFVGYGIVAPEYDYSDYSDVDVKGKVVVFLAGEPSSTDPEYFLGPRDSPHAALESKRRLALTRGAVGSVLIPSISDPMQWAHLRREYAFEYMVLAYSVPQHLSLILHPDRARELFADALYSFDEVQEMHRRKSMRSFYLCSFLSFAGESSSRSFLAPNLVAMVRGNGHHAAHTAVVVSAHYDHLGKGSEVAGDAIYNGVIDNALGVAGVLELARLLSEQKVKLRRSVLLVFTTAEEKGMLGSRYFLDHPPMSLPSLVADINVDGLAFMDRFSEIIGVGGELSDLGVMLRKAAARCGVKAVPPPEVLWSHEGFTRSEQVVFAEAGIPAILLNEGFAWQHYGRDEAARRAVDWMLERYHSPADDLQQPLDFGAAALHAWVVWELLKEVADSPLAPEWKVGVPYAYQRALSRAEAQR